MKRGKKIAAAVLAAACCVSALSFPASAKTISAGQTVDTVLFYATNSDGEDVLISHTAVAEMEADMRAGKIGTANHNYSVLDRYVTTVHQEAQGFTCSEYIAYARSKSTVAALRDLPLAFEGRDEMSFWEIDQRGFDEDDTYTCASLYGTPRYKFPLLYEYWDYAAQDYFDPNGRMSREEVIDYIFDHGERETALLSVRAFSERYIMADGKYGSGDYNMENYWLERDLLDNRRAVRMMIPMTERDLREKNATAFAARYWCAIIRLSMENAPAFAPLGTVAAPTAVMTEDEEKYYVTFNCETPGAVILYNHNFASPGYTPSCEYTGGAVEIPKELFKNGVVTMTCRAVRDGWMDAGVVTLELEASGPCEGEEYVNPWSDVAEGKWYYGDVRYVTENGYFDAAGEGAFSPEAPMTRAMLAVALYRMAGAPAAEGAAPFTDVNDADSYAEAVAWCYTNGVISGYEDATFRPGGEITREQIAALFYRYAAIVAGADMTADNDLSGYTDRNEVSGWALANVRWAVGSGLITGMTATTIGPKGMATRAQAAALVQRLAGYLEG